MRRATNKIVPHFCLAFLVVSALNNGTRADDSAVGKPKAGDSVDFNRDVRPILSARCLNCHGIDEGGRKGELRLDQRADAVRDRDGYHVVKPGDPAESELVARIISTDAEEVMPPGKTGPPLKPAEIDILSRWIAQGANYAEHWSFQPVGNHQPPAVSDDRFGKTPIDRFIFQNLTKAGLTPAQAADRATLIRRLSLDLTGLPPSPQEVDAFVADKSPEAVATLINRLIDSPHYGEKMARNWLDLARYADSKGYGSDPLREYMWRYRDWVIQAFNSNLPYDKFVRQQIAGDLLPNATTEQILATSFQRQTMSNDEGGTDDEEFRVAAIKDRVDTTGQVFMGLTVGCAKCHTHKFDPISQREYYQLFAVFNQTEDNDNPNDEPRLPTPTPEQAAQFAALETKIDALAHLPIPKGEAFKLALEGWTAQVKNNVNWQAARIESAKTAKNRKLEIGLPGEVQASGTAAKATDTLTITIPKGVTAIRLEAVANETEIKGPGLAPHGNFVLSSITGTIDQNKPGVEAVRYVRIDLPGTEKMLSLAEVQVFHESENIALKGKASQSSTDFNGPAQLANDGKTDGEFETGKSVTHTAISKDPWWELDLGDKPARVDRIMVWNRTDGDLESRLTGAHLTLLDANRKPLYKSTLSAPPNPSKELVLGGPVPVQFAAANSSYDQPGFEVAKAIRPVTAGKNEGWGVGGMPGRTQDAVFVLASPLPAGKLTLKLAQNWGEQHTLGRYSITYSTAPEPPKALPVAIRDLALGCDCCRTPEDQTKISEYYWRNIAPENRQAAVDRTKLETELNKLKSQVVRTPVLKELPKDKRRETHILVKGSYTQLGDVVQPGVMATFLPPPKPTGDGPLTRLDLANWITNRENPLTARVAVNRIWAIIYGKGLVETEEDFGTQGRPPANPELLDYLAQDFMNHGWDIKYMVRQIVSTATYQQSSVPTDRAKIAVVDPLNNLLSFYPRTRLEAETIRDQALVISGLFSPKIGGASVYPPQPDNLWQAAFNGQRTYPTSTGPDRYRRGLYTFWRRTTPNPSMTAFDAPSREVCSIRRIGSNTPLQAYVTLNDPVFVEAAQALGRRILKEGGATLDDQLKYGYKLATARDITDQRLNILKSLYTQELERYKADNAAAKLLAESTPGSLPKEADPAAAAAMTVIGNVLLNLDAVLTKG